MKRRLAIIAALSQSRALHFPRPRFDPAVTAHPQFLIAAIIVWSLFSLYWEAAARTAAPAQTSESPLSRSLHVGLVNLAAMLVLIPFDAGGRALPASPFLMAAGLTLHRCGTWLAVCSRRHLGRNWSGAIQIKVDPELVRSGPYRRVRHPIYTGLLLGVALVLVAYWRKIRLEEATLQTAFPTRYDAYRRDSWALIPGLY
jgi:protein-S-isoprenylcysteine O-methyltransferase Ste14